MLRNLPRSGGCFADDENSMPAPAQCARGHKSPSGGCRAADIQKDERITGPLHDFSPRDCRAQNPAFGNHRVITEAEIAAKGRKL